MALEIHQNICEIASSAQVIISDALRTANLLQSQPSISRVILYRIGEVGDGIAPHVLTAVAATYHHHRVEYLAVRVTLGGVGEAGAGCVPGP